MQPNSSSYIFHTSLAFHPSSLAARNSTRVGNRSVGSQWWCSTTGFSYGTGGMVKPPRGPWSLLRCGVSPKEGIHESRREHPTS
jgi:hypothetical protein